MENETQDVPEIRIYKVFEFRMKELNERIGKLNRRAKKLGVAPVVVTQVSWDIRRQVAVGDEWSTFVSKAWKPNEHVLRDRERFTGVVAKVLHLTVTGSTPKLAGWEFIGKIEVVRDEEGKKIGNMLRLMPDAEAPAKFRNVDPWCDHCDVNRRWAETFIIKHESGVFKQVGRRCIADFLGGVNPDTILASAEYILNVKDLVSDSEEDAFGGGYSGPSTYEMETLLERTACHIRRDGWMSKGKAAMLFGTAATSTNVVSQIEARTEKEQKVWSEYVVTEADKKTAADTMEWLEALPMDEQNEYRYSLALLSRAGSIKANQVGTLCSAVPAMLRDKEQELNRRLRAEAHRQSEHIGAPKQRLVLENLKIEFIRHIESNFGSVTLYTFVDANNNVIKWFSSTGLVVDGRDAEVNDVVTLKATIKEHGVYNEIKDTQITRAKLLSYVTQMVA